MKRKSPRTCQSYSPFPRSAKQTSDPLVQTDSKIKETLYTIGYRKLETELLFLKKLNIRNWNVLSVKGMIFRIVTAKILYRPKKLKQFKSWD